MRFNKLSKYKTKKILKCFCEEITATQTARLLSLNRNTINRYFKIFREAILKASLAETAKETGVFELDESYF